MARLVLGSWDPWREFDSFFAGMERSRAETNPPLNVFYNEENVLVTSEAPAICTEDVDISVAGNTLTIKGNFDAPECTQDATWHRRERGADNFYRTVRLPYNVDNSKVEATYEKGILSIKLPRSAADKPRSIKVKSA